METLQKPKGSPSYNIQDELNKFNAWLLYRRYSHNSIKTYIDALKNFLLFLQPKTEADATNDDMVRFVNDYILKNGYSLSFQNQVVNACKLYFKEVAHSELDVNNLKRPRREHKLPNVLSKEEVKVILDAPTNLKHRAMLSIIYACGFRRSELLNLKLQDVDSKRHLLLIRKAKGRKDRVVPISEKTITMLCNYFVAYKPVTWLFEGQKV
ncbi:MAG TPA: tyrosine-type recombinase/integrase, partial [Bacteroidales bacterium]|nr:tyrosine-type recombinase/integrase [Bacteroidales bacterium]